MRCKGEASLHYNQQDACISCQLVLLSGSKRHCYFTALGRFPPMKLAKTQLCAKRNSSRKSMVTHRMTLRRIGLTMGASLIAFGSLVACTRNRPTPEPTAVSDAAAITVLTNTTSSGGEPVVTVVATIAPTAAVASAGTPTPGALTPKTIDYYVQEGDTLAFVAQKFEIELETLRQLNYLLDDKIFVGQILQVPYREGITAEGVPTATPAPFSYVVEEGDSLGTIAQQFGVSAVSIMEANNLQNPNNVFIGQTLIIPNYVPPNTSTGNNSATANNTAGGEQAGGDAVSHVVQPGETLYGIAQKYGVDANAIAEANNVANRNQLRVGQKLTIPGITARQAAEALGRVHVVQSGESLTAIAQQYGISAEEIISFNNISNPDAIYVGQELIIPGQ
ncbi:MAG: LysM peptidoglycan-binding domain-containing protein [Caldilinea sp. CFX5]|nr:LysM peptidoglycan-binding domain-containing protein [Caldilinea sp. CFX5]